MQHMAVRRLTPRECERLQGFPDNYTLIPYHGKLAADGPRYKALGNSMAVGDTHQERARLLKLQADKTELEVDTIKGKLIPADEAEELWASLLATFRSRMLAMPTRAAHLVSHLREFYAIEHTLRDLVIDALTELARYDPNSRTTDTDTSVETPESAAETDDQPVGGSLPLFEQRI